MLSSVTQPTCVADTGVVNLHADLVGLGRSNLDILDAQLLASLPGNGSLAGDGLHASLISFIATKLWRGARPWRGIFSASAHLSNSRGHCVSLADEMWLKN